MSASHLRPPGSPEQGKGMGTSKFAPRSGPQAPPRARVPSHQISSHQVMAPANTTIHSILPAVRAQGHGRTRGTIALGMGAAGLAVSLWLGINSVRAGLDLPGGRVLAVGTLAALSGAYLCLAMLLLISRVPWLEREVGHDKMIALHRRVAPWCLALILVHVGCTTVSYAQAAETSVLGQLWTIITVSEWMVPAATAFVLMMSVGLLSWRRIRTRMSYETWWVAHLYFYISVALSFGHQIALGAMFVDHPVHRWFWISLYLAVAATIVVCRFSIPIATSLRHDLKIAAIVPEADGVISIYLKGRNLNSIQAQGGQFFQWRFLTRHWWWQAHPYSLSAAPNRSWLRITIKDLGDQSAALSELAPGTRVLVEGPYGVFTAASRHSDRIVAFAAGIGITPIRALLDELPTNANVTLVYRVSDADTAPLRAELDALADAHQWTLHYLQGAREQHDLSACALTNLIPGLAECDVYVCGPKSFTSSILGAVRTAGVPERRLHHEAFTF